MRVLTTNEVGVVSGGGEYLPDFDIEQFNFNQIMSQLDPEEIVVTASRYHSYIAGTIGIGAGIVDGLELTALLESGAAGAEIGAFAGPIGFLAGAVTGIGVYYALDSYMGQYIAEHHLN